MPDEESEQWVAAIVDEHDVPACIVGRRQADFDVAVTQALFFAHHMLEGITFGDGGDPLLRFLVWPYDRKSRPASYR